MTESLLPIAAASAWPITLPQLSVQDSPIACAILRLWRPAPATLEALSREFSVQWPTVPNTRVGNEGSILWLAPAEWAIVGWPSAAVAERVARACSGTIHHLADVSEGRIAFDLRGGRARDVLAKGCSLDLHPAVFNADACAQTLLGDLPVLIESCPPTAAAPHYRVYCDISYRQWLQLWLQDAALEYR